MEKIEIEAALEKLAEGQTEPEVLTMISFLIEIISENALQIKYLMERTKDQVLMNDLLILRIQRLEEGKNETN